MNRSGPIPVQGQLPDALPVKDRAQRLPTISVVTAVFNRHTTVGHALDSVRCQAHPWVEHVVVDGASTDGTLAVLRRSQHERMVLVSEPDHGIYDAINKGIGLSSGDVIGLLHSDDFFAHEHVLGDVAALFAATGADLLYGDLEYVGCRPPYRVIRAWKADSFEPSSLGWGWMPPHPTVYVRRSVFERWGDYDTSFEIAADYDAMLRYLRQPSLKTAYLPEVMVKMRVGGESNRTLRRIIRKSWEDYRAIRNNRAGGLVTLASKNLRKISQFRL